MRLAFTPEQQELHKAVEAVFVDHCTPAVLRAASSGEPVVDSLWDRITELGLPAAMVGEGAGGLGLDDVDLVRCFEVSGEVALPLPLVETVAVGAPVLAVLGHLSEVDGIGAGWVRLSASMDGSRLFPFAEGANLIYADDGGLWLITAGSAGLEEQDTVDRSRPLHRLMSRPDSATLLTRDEALITNCWNHGVVATSAQLLGLAQRMLSMTVDYVRTREQFGVPIGSFQAIKHRLADALCALELARPMVYAASWAVALGTDTADRDAAAAKAFASESATTVARAALQCHGAIGYTTEYDLHLYLKRTWALSSSWGTPAFHRAGLARMLGLV